jgi:Holliday junction resolvase
VAAVSGEYRRGVYREKRTAEQLAKDGYLCVESRGSHGVCDVLAVKLGQVLAVQVKSGDSELRGKWINALFEAATAHGAIPLVADWPKRGQLRLRRITGLHRDRSPYWPLEPFTTDEAAGP